MLYLIIIALCLQIFLPQISFAHFNTPSEISGFSQSQDSALSVIGRWAWGSCFSVELSDSICLIGNGSTIQSVDISKPTPVLINEYVTKDLDIFKIEKRDSLLFVCMAGGVLILRITSTGELIKMSEIDIDALADFALGDSFIYTISRFGTFKIVDIQDITYPHLRGSLQIGKSTSIGARESFVYCGDLYDDKIKIVDVSDPDNPAMQYLAMNGWIKNLIIKDSIMYTALSTSFYNGTMFFKIYDISNAYNPLHVGDVEIADSCSFSTISVSADDSKTYFGISADLYNNRIYSIDITYPVNPVIDYTVQFQNFRLSGSVVSGNYLVTSNVTGASVFDIHEDSLVWKYFYPTGGESVWVVSEDSIAYLASGNAGVWILNISNASAPQAISNIQTNGYTTRVLKEDTLLYLINASVSNPDSTLGLWIVGVSDIDHPKILSHYPGIIHYSEVDNAIIKSGNYIFITQKPNSSNLNILEIVDVSDPYEPVHITTLENSYTPHNIAVKNNIIYLGTTGNGLRVLDITNPFNPVEVNVFRPSRNIWGVFIRDNYLYADGLDTLFILDITNPVVPEIIGKSPRANGSFSTVNIYADDKYLYWAEGLLGLFDVSDKSNPVELESILLRDYARSCFAYNHSVFVADRKGGLYILKNNLISSTADVPRNPTNYKLYQNYPNPFNSSTLIRYRIEAPSLVKLSVIDLLGREVNTLVNEWKNPGTYSVNFNGNNLASGLYFYRITTGSAQQINKMLLMK